MSAGFAAAYPTTSLDSVAMAYVNRAVELLMAHQEPYGGVLIDRSWNMLRINDGASRLLGAFLDPTVVPPRIATNLVRATLHPEGLRSHIVNWSEVATLIFERVERAHHAHPEDEQRRALLEEIRTYPEVEALAGGASPSSPSVAVLHLRRGPDELRLFSLLTTVGTPLDVIAQDLAIESFFPADDATERWFRSPR